MSAAPITLTWDGEAFRPAGRFMARLADKEFVIGMNYRMVEHNERSTSTHNHYWAALTEAHRNLPEHLAAEFPTVEKLRAFALIRTGFCNSHSIVVSSNERAEDIAAFMRPMDEFAVVDVQGSVITVYTAKSQSYRAMDRKEFQASKDAVLDLVAGMVGVGRDALEQNAGRAA